MRKNKFIKGIVDPFSLIVVGFFLLTVISGVAVVKNKDVSMNISKFAKMVSEESGIGKTSSTTKKTPTPTVFKMSPTSPTPNPTNQETESGKTSPLTPTTTPINQESQVGKTSPPTSTPTPTPIDNQENQAGKTSPPTPTPTPISLSTKTCTVNKCSGINCVGSSITIPYDAGCPASSCANNTDCKTTTPTKCDCIDGVYDGTQCGSLIGKKCGKTPTPTPIPTPYCNEIMYTDCVNGCIPDIKGGTCKVTKKGIGETCSIDSECSSGNCYSGSSIMGGSPFDSIKTCRSQSISTMDTTIRDLNTRTGIAMTAELGLLAAPAIGEAALAGYSYSTAFFSTLPTSVQTAIAVGGTVAGYAGVTAGTVACVDNPYSDACVAYVAAIQGDPLAMIQLAQSTDSLINVALVKYTSGFKINTIGLGADMQTTIAPKYTLEDGQTYITLYHGSQNRLIPVLDDGLHGYVGFATLSTQIEETPMYFAYSTGIRQMRSSPLRGLGGYILEVKVPPNLVIFDNELSNISGISETYYSLSQQNAFIPGGLTNHDQFVTLSPRYISNIFPVTPDGKLGTAIPFSQWPDFATKVDLNIEQAAMNLMQSINPIK